MIELVGKKSRFGVEPFLRQVKGETSFADLLQTYDVNTPTVPAIPRTATMVEVAPIGEIISDGTTVTCHLCGRALKSVAAHLRRRDG